MNEKDPDLDFSMSESFNFNVNRQDSLLKSEWVREVLVLVGNRFGMNSVEEKFYASIKRFMKLPSFVGLVGG
jgi:hypothetical protein